MKFAAAGFDKIELVKENEAESSRLLGKIDNFCKNIRSGDLLVFYFAGHGRELNGEHYLVAKDGFADPKRYTVGSLPMSAVVDTTNKPGVRRLFILDCCRDNLLAGRSTAFVCNESRSIALDHAVRAQSGFIPPLILNSCSSGEKAFEDTDSGHGYFTKALLKTIGDAAINNFSVFRKQLNRNMNSSGTQNICWNGNVDDWDEVKLFDSWNPASSPAHALQPYPANYYDACLEAEESEKTLEKYKLPLSSAMSSAKRKAEIARNNGDWNKEIEFRQDFIKLITDAVDAEKQRIADVKAEAEGALKCASQVLKFSKKTVTGVKDKNITSIVIPDGVTTIGGRAFSDCKSLTSVTIPDSVTEIGWYAFSDCTSLTSVTIPSSVKKIDSGAFSGCTSLTSVTIPDSVTTIGSYAFWGCTSLTSVTIPRNCKYDESEWSASFPEGCKVIRR